MTLTGLSADDFSPACEVIVPDSNTPLHDVVSRWSDKHISLPAAVVVPATEEDVLKVVQYASERKLKLLPASGGHGSCVSVNEKTLYLDMKKFNGISVGVSNGTVTMGGGSIVGDVYRACAEKGYYTHGPNSNAIGMVGAIIGGCSGPLNGLHGLGIDNVRSIRLVTASSRILDLTSSSTGEEKALFNAMCGGGHGLGVVTSLTMRAYPSKNLNMDDDKVWVRRAIFPASKIDYVAQLFPSLLPPPPALMTALIFMRSPPGSPHPGAPMIMISAQYFGPSPEAERAASVLFAPEVSENAIMVNTSYVSFVNLNDTSEPLNRHGGFKETYTSLVERPTKSHISGSFDRWIQFGKEVPDAMPTSYVVVGSWNTKHMIELATQNSETDEKFYPYRDRGLFTQATAWYTKEESGPMVDAYGAELVAITRAEETGNPASFVNNLRKGMDFGEVYTKEQTEELRRVKGLWDPEGVFWSPAVEGW